VANSLEKDVGHELQFEGVLLPGILADREELGFAVNLLSADSDENSYFKNNSQEGGGSKDFGTNVEELTPTEQNVTD